jgi:hypothetical protein
MNPRVVRPRTGSPRRGSVITSGVVVVAALLAGFDTPALAAADARAASVTEDLGKAQICVSGTHGRFARLALLDRDRHVVTVFHLRKGCRTFRLGADLSAGTYVVKHRAPRGRLTRETYSDYLWCDENGGCLISAVSRDRNYVPPPAKKVKAVKFTVDEHSAVTVGFRSVKARRG